MKRNLIKYCLLSYEVCVCLVQQNKPSHTTNAIQNKPNRQAKLKSIYFTLLQNRILLCICHSRYIYTTKCLCKKVIFSYFMSYDRVCNKNNTTGVTGGARTTYPSGTHEFIPSFKWGSCCSFFNFH